MSKWATASLELIKSKPKGYSDAIKKHNLCNWYLYRLRCGSRRYKYGSIRNSLRNYRSRLAKQFHFPKMK